ncbi:DUF779 domain-containing protein [Pantoea ananatis]|uniref:DUF779 domain-containing protein n=1 Tax=Pantoea ananas TaxID=553 RepID=UPI0039B96AF4
MLATLPALQLIAKLRARHGALLFHQSGGCCDGSSPMCYPQDVTTCCGPPLEAAMTGAAGKV